MDYEHQPANHLAFRLATAIVLPTALPDRLVRRQGASARKLFRYRGLKEELYLGDFEPDPRVMASMGIDRPPDAALVVARTPPSGALYHGFDNPLFLALLEKLTRDQGAHCVLLARAAEERRALAGWRLPNCVIPETAVDSRSLMHAADMVLGAGGTMTREAALLGVPAVSVYAGPVPAVDRWLEAQGLLRRVSSPDQLGPIPRRRNDGSVHERLRRRGDEIGRVFIRAILEVAKPDASRRPVGPPRAQPARGNPR
jgi:predicted glycosyltransferase